MSCFWFGLLCSYELPYVLAVSGKDKGQSAKAKVKTVLTFRFSMRDGDSHRPRPSFGERETTP
jgi:hypothetical protein